MAIGKPTYRGPTVQGTDEAIGTELEEAFRRMDGPEREEFQRQVDRVRAEFEKDRAEGGKGWKALMEVGRV